MDDVQSTRSLRSLVLNLFGAAEEAGNPVDRDVRKNTLLWIDGELLQRGLAHRISRKKPVATPQDITSFIRHLFTPQFMCTLPTTRDTLLIALFSCLMIDCGGRASEFVRPSMSIETQKAYAKEHAGKVFTWGNVEVFAFAPDVSGDPVVLQARLGFRSIKDSGNKGYKTKTIPLRLLPVNLVAEDSLFWLLTLGLIDEVFDGISTWKDFDGLRPGPNGLRIHIKGEKAQLPVSEHTLDVV